MVDGGYLWGVVSLPSGVFNPYAGVKTSILLIDKTIAAKSKDILFVKISNDGFDLGAQRRPFDKNDLPEALNNILEHKRGSLSTFPSNFSLVPKSQISKQDYNLSADRFVITKTISVNKWPLIELGKLFNMQNGRAFQKSEWKTEGLPIIRIANLNSLNADYNYFDGEYDKKIEINKGDLLFSWSGTVGTSFGPHYWKRSTGLLNQHIFRLDPKTSNIDKKYAYYAIKQLVPEIEAQAHGAGGLVHITKEKLIKFEIPLPPIEIQKQIVEELDGYQKIIDGAKQVVDNWKPRINIDQNWSMVHIPEIAENNDNMRKPVTKSDRVNGQYPYYGASGIVDYVDNYIFDGEYLLISEDGANLLARNTPIAFSISGKTWVNNHSHIFKFDNRYTQKYVEMFINQIDISNFVTGMAQPKLNQQALNSIEIPLPPMDLQQQIVDQMESEKTIIDGNQKIIEIYQQKIKDKINEV